MDGMLAIAHPYFQSPEPTRWDGDAQWAGTPKLEHATTYCWNHGLGEIITALLKAGLRIEEFAEHRLMAWQLLPQMVQGDDKQWRMPDHGDQLPLMYSIRATKPE